MNGTVCYVPQLLFSATEHIDSTSAIDLDYLLATSVLQTQSEVECSILLKLVQSLLQGLNLLL